ncbi:MAG: acyl--CoA ligase [Symploca sp. SIO1C2]|nr:acyl--CoA ligase [Symploca sp. SIO1C2]
MKLHESVDFANAHVYRGVTFDQKILANQHLLEFIHIHSRQQPESIYITSVSNSGKTEELPYRELDRLSRLLAAWTIEECGLAPGDILGLIPENKIFFVVTIFALLRAGASILFLNPNDPPSRIREQIEAMRIKHLLLLRDDSDYDDLSVKVIPPFDELDIDPDLENFRDKFVDFKLYFGTSGSTAAAKLVEQSQYNAIVNAKALCKHHSLKENDTILGCLPIHHVNGLHFTLFASMIAGAHTILLEKFNPMSYFEYLNEYQCRIGSVVPSILEALLSFWKKPEFPANFDYFVSAAAPLQKDTCARFYKDFGVKVMQGYGLTETTNFSTTMPADISDEAYLRYAIDSEILSIGIALFGNDLAVLDENDRPLPNGEIGEICVCGHNVMNGYYHNSEQTQLAFQGGWFHTQDLGYQLLDETTGRTFFFITGRLKNLAKVFGIAVSLEELERYLANLDYLADAACFSIPSRLMGEEIVVALVPKEGARVNEEEIGRHLARYISSSVVPTKFLIVEKIPRTATGKILRKKLAALCQDKL